MTARPSLPVDVTQEQADALNHYAIDDPGRFCTDATDEAWSIVFNTCGLCGNNCHPDRHCDRDGCRACPEATT